MEIKIYLMFTSNKIHRKKKKDKDADDEDSPTGEVTSSRFQFAPRNIPCTGRREEEEEVT